MLIGLYRVCMCEVGGLGIVNFSSFLLLRIMCIKYLMESCERVFMSL